MSHTFDLPFRKLLRFTPLLLILVCSVSLASGQTNGTIATVAGNQVNHAISVCSVADGNDGDGIGDGCPATSAALWGPTSVASDSYGNLYIADSSDNVVRFVYSGSAVPAMVTNLIAAQGLTLTKDHMYLIAGQYQNTCYYGGDCGDGEGLATNAMLDNPIAVAIDENNNLFILDSNELVVRKVDASTGNISLVAGTYYTSFSGGKNSDGGAATSAVFNQPTGLATDASGNIYVADTTNSAVWEIDASDGIIHLIAGTYTAKNSGSGSYNECTPSTSSCGDGGAATLATLSGPKGVFVDASGDIFIADTNDQRIRVIYEGGTAGPLSTLTSPTIGNIYTIAGTGAACTSTTPTCGDGGSALSATFDAPYAVAVSTTGDVFVSDGSDYTIRKIDASGVITAIAGTELTPGYTGDGGKATAATLGSLYTPVEGITIDESNNLYIADTANHVIREVYGAAVPTLKSQTLTFDMTLSETAYSATSIDLTGLAVSDSSSGLPVTYTVGSNSPGVVSGTNGTTLTLTSAGTVTVIANQAGNSAYAAATSISQLFTVDKATLTVTANKASVPFGTSVSALASTYETYTPSGLVGTDSLTGAPAYTISNCSDGNSTYTATTVAGTTCTITPTVNTLAISPTTKASSYYSPFTYASNTLTVVGGDTQTITFPTLTGPFTYGMSPIALSATATSKQPVSYSVDNTSVATITGDSTSGFYLTIKGAGQVTVTASQGGTNNYAPAQSVSQVLNIGRATVTVTAGSFSVGYGSTLTSSQFSYSASSLIATNDQLSGTPTYATNCGGNTSYSATTAVGTSCAISVSGFSISPAADAANYTINYATGTLTVIQGTQSINWVQPGNVTYAGGATQTVTLTASATSGLPLSATVSGPAKLVAVSGTTVTVQTTGGGAVLGVGTVTVLLTQTGGTNYAAAAPVAVSFNVNPATLYVKANDLTMAPGATVPTLTWSFTCDSSGGNSCSNDFVGTDTNTPAVVSGLPVLSTLATSTSSTGNYTINIAQGTLTAQNYNIVTVNGTLTITGAPTYIVTANPSTLTIRSGQTGQATILVTPTNGYQGTVAFSCGNLPTNVTCTFSPASVTLTPASSGVVGAQQTTVTINTNASSPVVGMLAPYKGSQVLTASLFFLPGGLTGLLIAFNRKRLMKHKRIQGLLILVALLSGLTGLSACGGSTTKNVATAGTNTVTITAAGTGTSGSGSPNATNVADLTVVITQ